MITWEWQSMREGRVWKGRQVYRLAQNYVAVKGHGGNVCWGDWVFVWLRKTGTCPYSLQRQSDSSFHPASWGGVARREEITMTWPKLSCAQVTITFQGLAISLGSLCSVLQTLKFTKAFPLLPTIKFKALNVLEPMRSDLWETDAREESAL